MGNTYSKSPIYQKFKFSRCLSLLLTPRLSRPGDHACDTRMGRSPYVVTDSPGEQSLAVTVIQVLASCLSAGQETYTSLECGEKEQLLILRASPEVDLPSFLEGAAPTHFSKWKPKNMACSSCSLLSTSSSWFLAECHFLPGSLWCFLAVA